MSGLRRSDGLWVLTDTEAYAFANSFRGEIAPGEPIHDRSLRLMLDDDLAVISAEAATAAGPFAVCPAITPAFVKLEGLRIDPGWRRAVQARFGGVQGWTHLVELLGPLATTAYQTIHAWRARHQPQAESDRPPPHLDSCDALAATARSSARTIPAGTPDRAPARRLSVSAPPPRRGSGP